MTRVADDSMALRYSKGHWLGLVRCRRPAKGRDVIFVDGAGNMILGEVRGITSAGSRIGQFHGEPRYSIRRLSSSRWQPAWRVVAVYLTAGSAAFYEAVGLGMYARARQIQLAIGRKGPMPPPLSDAQRSALPRIVKAP
jgi:hypothetical protein